MQSLLTLAVIAGQWSLACFLQDYSCTPTPCPQEIVQTLITVRKHQRFIAVGVSLQFNNKSPQRLVDCFLLFSGHSSLLRAKYWSFDSAFNWTALRQSLNSEEYLQKGGKTKNLKLCYFIHFQTKCYRWSFHLCQFDLLERQFLFLFSP